MFQFCQIIAKNLVLPYVQHVVDIYIYSTVHGKVNDFNFSPLAISG